MTKVLRPNLVEISASTLAPCVKVESDLISNAIVAELDLLIPTLPAVVLRPPARVKNPGEWVKVRFPFWKLTTAPEARKRSEKARVPAPKVPPSFAVGAKTPTSLSVIVEFWMLFPLVPSQRTTALSVEEPGPTTPVATMAETFSLLVVGSARSIRNSKLESSVTPMMTGTLFASLLATSEAIENQLMTQNPTGVSAVAADVSVIVKDPAVGMTFLIPDVASLD